MLVFTIFAHEHFLNDSSKTLKVYLTRMILP